VSRLIDKIDKLGRGAITPIGFGVRVAQEKSPEMLLIGLTRANLFKGRMKIQSFCDGFIIRGSEFSSSIATGTKELANVLWGAWPETLKSGDAESLQEKGGDFLVLQGDTIPLEALAEGEMGRILHVSLNATDQYLRTLDDLPIDAVLLELTDEKSVPLTLEHLVQIATIRTMISCPLMIVRPCKPSQQEIIAMRNAGVEALVIDITKVSPKELDHLHNSLINLPQKKSRPEKAVAKVPYLHDGHSPRQSTPDANPEEEEEEEEEE
jgi:hypothetical protein